MREGRIRVNHAKVAICGATLVVAERPWERSKAELNPSEVELGGCSSKLRGRYNFDCALPAGYI